MKTRTVAVAISFLVLAASAVSLYCRFAPWVQVAELQHGVACEKADISENGAFLAGSGGGLISLWSPLLGVRHCDFIIPEGEYCSSAAFCEGAELFGAILMPKNVTKLIPPNSANTGSKPVEHATAKVWEIRSGREVFSFSISPPAQYLNGSLAPTINAMSFSDDGRLSLEFNGVPSQWRTWDIDTGNELVDFAAHGSKNRVDEANGKTLSFPGHNRLLIHDARTGDVVFELNAYYGSPILDAKITRNSKFITVADEAGNLSIWRNRRPETIVGILYMPESWILLICGGFLLLLTARAVVNRREMGAATQLVATMVEDQNNREKPKQSE